MHGAARDTLDHAALVADRELASAVDNPVITLDGRVESNGNFHGAPVGYVLDFLAIGVADVAKGRVSIGLSSRDKKDSDPDGIVFNKIARDAICIGTAPGNKLAETDLTQGDPV